jgi:hypothetical protein
MVARLSEKAPLRSQGDDDDDDADDDEEDDDARED